MELPTHSRRTPASRLSVRCSSPQALKRSSHQPRKVLQACRKDTIIPKLREAEVDLAKGLTVAQASKKIGVTEQTYYRWRKECGGLRMDLSAADTHQRNSHPLPFFALPPAC